MNFCPDLQMNTGYCCEQDQSCPNNYGYCSNDVQIRSVKDFLCPNSAYCGKYNLQASSTIQTKSIIGQKDFVQYDLCHYLITAPSNSQQGDIIQLEIQYLNLARIVVNQSPDFQKWQQQQTYTTYGSKINIIVPNKAYLSIYADSFIRGDFQFTYQFIKVVKTDPTPPSNNTSQNNNNTNSSQSNQTQQTNNTKQNVTVDSINDIPQPQGQKSVVLIILIVVAILVFLSIIAIIVIILYRRVNKLKMKTLPISQNEIIESQNKENEKTIEGNQAAIFDDYYMKRKEEKGPSLNQVFDDDSKMSIQNSEYFTNKQRQQVIKKKKTKVLQNKTYKNDSYDGYSTQYPNVESSQQNKISTHPSTDGVNIKTRNSFKNDSRNNKIPKQQKRKEIDNENEKLRIQIEKQKTQIQKEKSYNKHQQQTYEGDQDAQLLNEQYILPPILQYRNGMAYQQMLSDLNENSQSITKKKKKGKKKKKKKQIDIDNS